MARYEPVAYISEFTAKVRQRAEGSYFVLGGANSELLAMRLRIALHRGNMSSVSSGKLCFLAILQIRA